MELWSKVALGGIIVKCWAIYESGFIQGFIQ